MSIESEIVKVESLLNGRKATHDEVESLVQQFPKELVPDWLLLLLRNFPLSGSCFEVDEDDDISEMGADIKWLTPEQILDEGLNAYPGKVVLLLGYLPIGSCLAGSGDPYFIKLLDDSDDPSLVRIPHECSSDENYPEEEIEVVFTHLSELFKVADIG